MRSRSALLLLAFLTPSLVSAEEVVAVISSHLEPYQEALDGFQKGFGTAVPALEAGLSSSAITDKTRVIVAFGSRATSQPYPHNAKLVYCMAPGVHAAADDRLSQAFHIAMTPPAPVILEKMQTLQPALHRVGLLWISDNQQTFSLELDQAARGAGM